MIKKATYHLLNGGTMEISYDSNAPCRVCALPVGEASMGGIDLCPACDMGIYRDGIKWSNEYLNTNILKIEAQRRANSLNEINIFPPSTGTI